MDYKNIKLIYDEAVNIKTSLNVEYSAVKHLKFEQKLLNT